MRALFVVLLLGMALWPQQSQGGSQRKPLAVDGTLQSGTRPIPDATVTLYQAGAAMSETAVALGAATTNARGSFAIAYHPPEDSAVLYLVARGGGSEGMPGSIVRLAAVLGPASAQPATAVINERTTVAAAWSMAQFLVDENLAGTSPGLQNAAGMNANLVDVQTGEVGQVLATPPNGSETTTLAATNTLANMLAACVNAGQRKACDELFTLATPRGGPRPDNTLTAALNIAHHPANNASALFAFGQVDQRYTPILERSPDAWTLALKFTGSSMDGPANMVFDPEGNVWSTNNYAFGTTTGEPGTTIVKLSPTGVPAPGTPYSGGGVLGSAFGIAMDQQGNVWVGNFAKSTDPPTEGSLSKFASDGTPLSPDGTGFTQGGANQVQGVAVDQDGNVWFANFGGDSVGMYPGGDPTRAQTITGGGLDHPFGVAIDGQGEVWVTNGPFAGDGGDSVSKFSRDGVPVSGSPFTGGGLSHPKGIAIDSLGTAWVANLGEWPVQTADSVTMLLPDGRPAAGAPFTGGGILGAWGIAVDGKDNVWVANFGGETVSHLCGARPANCPPGLRTGDPISPPTGYTSNALQRMTSVQIDASGNVWVANNWKHIPIPGSQGGNGLMVFLGMAAPVKTPLNGLPRQP